MVDAESVNESPVPPAPNLGEGPSAAQTVAETLAVGTSIPEQGKALPAADAPEGSAAHPVAASAESVQPTPAESKRSSRIWLRFSGAEWVAEKWFARQVSRQLLHLYERVHRDEPQLIGRALYEQIVIRRSDIDGTVAARVLRRAEQSFCDWPSGRDLRFRDLVQYIVIDEYLRSHAATLGTRTNMLKSVARTIPENL